MEKVNKAFLISKTVTVDGQSHDGIVKTTYDEETKVFKIILVQDFQVILEMELLELNECIKYLRSYQLRLFGEVIVTNIEEQLKELIEG